MNNRNTVSFGVRLIALIVGIASALLFLPYHRWVANNVFGEKSQTYTIENNPEQFGPAYPAYWVTEDYWVGESCPVTSEIKAEAEKVLAPLDSDHISQTVVFCMPTGTVSQPDVWAKRFSKYYGVGLLEGPRKDNGIVWLLQYDEAGKVQVAYAVGDGLEKLDPYELVTVKIAVESSFVPGASQAENLALAIMSAANSYNQIARSSYQPFEPTTTQFGGPITKSEDDASAQLIVWAIVVVIWLTLLTEPFLAFFVVLFGARWAWQIMDWPLELAMAFINAKSSGSSTNYGSTPGHSSGKSLGGSTNTTRINK